MNEKLPWRIPLQHMGGDSEGITGKLGSPDSLRFAMILGTEDLDAQFLSDKLYLGMAVLSFRNTFPCSLKGIIFPITTLGL